MDNIWLFFAPVIKAHLFPVVSVGVLTERVFPLDFRPRPALVAAAINGHEDCVKVLLEAGAIHLDMALIEACILGQDRCAKVLLEAGADVNARLSDFSTALIQASSRGYIGCLTVLLQAGADVNIKATSGRTALTEASQAGYVDCVEALLDMKANGKPLALLLASSRGDRRCVEALLEAGADVNTVVHETTALCVACSNGDFGCLKVLLNAGADVNFCGKYGTPLFLAKSNIMNVRALLEAGADVNQRSPGGKAILDRAVHLGSDTLVCMLLKAGSEVNPRNRSFLFSPCMTLADLQICKMWMAACENGPDTTLSFFARLNSIGVGRASKAMLEFRQFLDEVNENTSLQAQCRWVIRRHLLSVSDVNLFIRVPKLPLPDALKKFMLFDVSLD